MRSLPSLLLDESTKLFEFQAGAILGKLVRVDCRVNSSTDEATDYPGLFVTTPIKGVQVVDYSLRITGYVKIFKNIRMDC